MKNLQAFPNPHRTDQTGMTMQQYAAIKLKVPDSGIDWLDEMIRQSLKDDFATKVLQAHLSMPEIATAISTNKITSNDVCGGCYAWAEVMMKAREA